MSERDNFAGGFIAGAILGGILGGVLGATLSSRYGRGEEEAIAKSSAKSSQSSASGRRRRGQSGERSPLSVPSEARIEEARSSLEDKIAQLNSAIDEARLQLSETAVLNATNHQAASDA